MSQQPIFHQRYSDTSRFVIWGEFNEGDDADLKQPRLTIGFRDGQPRFIVNTGVQGLEGLINFPMDMATFAGILVRLEEVAKGPNDVKFQITSEAPVYADNKPTKELKVVSKLYMGKSKEGIVYLMVIAEAKRKVVFQIKPSKFHNYIDKDGNKVDMGNVSSFMAIGISKMLLGFIGNVMTNYMVEEYNAGARKAAPTNKNATPVSNSNGGKKPPMSIDDLDDIAI